MKYFQFKRLIDEIVPRLEGARAQKVFQPGDFCVQIELYTGSTTEYLTVRTRPGQVAVYLAAERSGPKGEAASDLAMKLRSRLSGTVCTAAEQAPGDRVLRLDFQSSHGSCAIVIELFGVGGNLYLLDEKGRVAAVMDRKAAKSRGLTPGEDYSLPDPPPQMHGSAGDKPDPLADLMERESFESYNGAAAEYYESLAADEGLERLRTDIRRSLVRERKKQARALDDFRKAIDNGDKADWYRECGEILAANFRNVRRGETQARLPDFYAQRQGTMREIPLDTSLTPQQNIDRYFKRSRKLKSGAKYALQHLDETRARLKRLDELETQLSEAGSREEIRALASDAGIEMDEAKGKTGGRGKKQQRRLPYRKFHSADGSAILVGRGGKDNDELTFNVANGRDMWLHVANSTGSHVVLVCDSKGEWSHDSLVDAAHLAVQYSSLKGEPVADVDYTRRKYVGRPPNSAPGLVTMAERKTMRIRIDPKRLDRLHGK